MLIALAGRLVGSVVGKLILPIILAGTGVGLLAYAVHRLETAAVDRHELERYHQHVDRTRKSLVAAVESREKLERHVKSILARPIPPPPDGGIRTCPKDCLLRSQEL